MKSRKEMVGTAEVTVERNVEMVRAAIGCGLVQFARAPLQDVRLAIGERVAPPDPNILQREAGAPVGVLAKPLEGEGVEGTMLKMAPGEVRAAVLTVRRNPDVPPDSLHVVQVVQMDVESTRPAGGLWLVVQA
jgi:hypothetical protein